MNKSPSPVYFQKKMFNNGEESCTLPAQRVMHWLTPVKREIAVFLLAITYFDIPKADI